MRAPLAAVLVPSLLLLSPAPARGEEAWGKLLEGAAFDLVTAIEKGTKEAGEGAPFHVELEEAEGGAAYSVDVSQGTRTCNVVLDAKSGRVIEKEVEEEDHSAAVRAAKTPLAETVRAALKARPGRAVDAHLRLDAGKPVVAVKIFAEGAVEVVRVDAVTGSALPGAAPAGDPGPAYTDRFRVEAEEWASQGKNPWFVLEPGHVLVLEGTEDGKPARLTVAVLALTKTVDGVETRVVEEREEHAGRLVEVSRNYFAISKRTNAVYYFGEDVDEYAADGKVTHPGAWRSGEKGARFGLMMPGTPLLGARYFQEVAPGVAMDRAEVVSLSDRVETPAGIFEGCLTTRETTPLESGEESKSYVAGIGLVRDGGLRLVRRDKAATK